jgi:hypothetical protein
MAVIPEQKTNDAVKGMVGASSPSMNLGEIMAQRTAALQPYKAEKEATAKKASDFDAEKGVFEQQQKMRTAGEKYAALTAAQQKAEAAYEPVESLEEDMLNATFVPTQESAKDLAALYGLIGVVGWAIGSGGKGNAMRAMSAQNGMLEGYQKGRADLYKKEKDLFETNIKTLREKAKVVSEKARRVAELAAKDPQAAAELSAYISAQEGAEFYKANAEKFGYAKAAKDAEDSFKAADKIYAEIVKEHARAAKRTGKSLPMQGSDGNLYMIDGDGKATKVEKPEGVSLTKPTVDKTGTSKAKAVSAAGADRYGFGDIIATNLNEAVGTISNIVNLPYDVTTGIFQGRNTTGLLTAPLGALTNKLTTEDVQRYNKEIRNFGKFAARVVSGGRVVPASVQKDFEDQFLIREGDAPLSVLTSIAQMRQTIERAAEVKIKSSATDPSLKQLYIDGLDVVRDSIPFTINDVNKFANERDNNKTLADMFQEYGFEKKSSPAPSATQRTAQPQAPAEAVQYLKQHPEFKAQFKAKYGYLPEGM